MDLRWTVSLVECVRIVVIGKGILTSSGQRYVLSTGKKNPVTRQDEIFFWEEVFDLFILFIR